MSRSIVFAKDEIYHIYNRGVDKREIFSSDHDRNRFMILLYLCNSEKDVDISELFRQGNSFEDLFKIDRGETIVDIGLFYLMPNHFHLLIREKELNNQNGVSKFMKKISTAYTMYFNNKYQRTGALFQGRFKARHVSADNYLKYLYAYINLNPVKLIEPKWKEERIKNIKKAKEFIWLYKYSSCADYLGQKRLFGKLINSEPFPKYFDSVKDFSEMINFWLSYNDYEG